MYGKPGDFFFHYTTREAAFAHIVPERRLRLSPYAKMRDPMEAKSPSFGAGLAVPDDPEVEKSMNQAWLGAWQLVGTKRGRTKLLSLTIDAPDYRDRLAETFGRGWARARMWEQYAENHQGVCLLFHRERFQEVVLAQLRARAPGAVCGPVRYEKEGIAAEAAATMMLEPGVSAEGLADRHLGQHFNALFFLKLLDWESEHEFRFVEPSDDDDYSYVDYQDTLAAVMVGAEFPDWQVPAVLDACKRARVDARRVEWKFLNQPMPTKLFQEQPVPPEAMHLES
jgi:hypothetical protein